MHVKYAYIGRGKVFIDNLFIGNVPELNIGAEVEKEELLDYTQGGGGLYDAVQRASSVTFDFTFNDYNPDNLALALFGTTAAVAAGSVASESLTAPASMAKDYFLKTAKLADLAQAHSLTSDPAGTTYTDGTDYVRSAGGILLRSDGAINADDPRLANYESLATDLIQAFTQSGGEYPIIFDGLNDASAGNPVVVSIFKAKPGPASGLPLISSTFAANQVTGSIVQDPTKVGGGLSQYFTAEIARPIAA